MSTVLDTSALLAFVRAEPGANRVAELLADASVSAVNMAELASKLVDRGLEDAQVATMIDGLPVRTVAFDASQALASGLLRRATRAAGLSLGDRACLALAQHEGLPAVTADRAWAELDLGIPVEVIR